MRLSDAEKAGIRSLACSVVLRALEDLAVQPGSHHVSLHDQASAEAFLLGDPEDTGLDLWCHLAGVEEESVQARARKIVSQRARDTVQASA